MNDTPVFPIMDPDYCICRLLSEQVEPLQGLFDQCADFTLLVEGEGVNPDAAQEIFRSVPPGKLIRDKFLYGLLDRKGVIVGVLEGMRNYPDEMTWWIGLLLLVPQARRHGLGRKIMDAFSEYVLAHRGTAIMLGVVEENQAAYRFWQGLGFELLRQTEPRAFGRKIQKVNVMRRELTQKDVATQSS